MKTKRNRGGQPGNHNARKHGFYSSTLTPEQIGVLLNAVNLGAREPELVALRLKLADALRYSPGNRRILMEASRFLVRWYYASCCLTKKEKTKFKVFIRTAFTELAINPEIFTKRIVAEMKQFSEKTQNESRLEMDCFSNYSFKKEKC
jgi:uncharacterized protein YjcR